MKNERWKRFREICLSMADTYTFDEVIILTKSEKVLFRNVANGKHIEFSVAMKPEFDVTLGWAHKLRSEILEKIRLNTIPLLSARIDAMDGCLQ